MTSAKHLRRMQPGQAVLGSDGRRVGEVAEVFADVGVGEAWGSVGSIPAEGATAADPKQYAFSEAMPGEGSDYVRVARPNGKDLYIPSGAFAQVRDGAATLAVDADAVAAMQWDILPDFVNVRSLTDSGGGSRQA